MDDTCAVCADTLEWIAYGSCGHKEVCSTCVARLRFICGDRHCCICKDESSVIFVTKMEQKQISSLFYQLPPLSANCSWLVSQNLDAQDDNSVQSFYATHDPLLQYHCKIPELLGRRIRGSFHDWVILSNHPQNVIWSLWNPLTSKLICLPPLIHINGDFDDIEYCCLSSPPDGPNSVLLLTRINKPNIVFFRFGNKRKRSKWTEMSYAKQLPKKDDIIYCPTCCNGKVYALTLDDYNVIQVDIVFNDKEVVISLLPLRKYPFHFFNSGPDVIYLKGFGTELFCIMVGFDAVARNTLSGVCLYKLDMTSTTSMWEEIEDLKEAVFFVDHTRDNFSVFYNPEIPTKFGGYVHIRGDECGNMIYSYHVKDKTVSLTAMACLFLRNYVSLWECRLEGDDGEGKGKPDYKQEEYTANEIAIRSIRNPDEVESNNMMNESHLLDVPFHLLEKLMEFCVGIEYLKFRATCKRCNLAAPLIEWRNEAALKKTKWQTYSLVSPWLMMLENNRGIMSFTDPVFGDKYFIRTLPVSIHDNKLIFCSRYGWLLFYCNLGYLVFFNPFTGDVRKLPISPSLLQNLCFSAPPTSADCVVVGFRKRDGGAYILRLADQNPLWRRLNLSYGGDAPYTFCFTTFFGQDLYGLCKEGKLVVFKRTRGQNFSLKFVVAQAPKPRWEYIFPRYFLVKRNEHILLVGMEEFGHDLEIFQLNDSTKEWMKVDCLGRHTIYYICGATCFCIEAKTPQMQNKIFFPRLHCEDGKIVFCSVETGGYYTFDSNRTSYNCLNGTKYLLYPHAWIEPSW